MNMPPRIDSPLPPRIARIAGTIVLILGVFLVAAPVALAVYVFGFPELLPQHPALAMLRLEPFTPSPAARAAAFLVLLVSAAPMLWGLWELQRLFADYAKGRVFTRTAARRLSHFATALMVSAITRPLGTAGLSVALTFERPPGSRQFALSIGSDDLGLAVIGLALVVIAWVMGEAARVAEENAEFV